MPSYYTARSDDELRKLAEQQYQSYYDQLRNAARQKQERESLALENQRAGIQQAYQKQRDASDKSYRQAYSQADRETLRRGMQRSSYAAQRLANVQQEGIEANQNIWDQQRTAEGNLDAQIAQLSGQLADTLAGYDANQAADVLKRYNELQSEEYDRAREAEQYAESIRQWQTQFDESVRQFNQLHPTDAGGGGGGGYSGGYSGGGGGSSGKKTPAETNPTAGAADWLDKAGGGGTSATKIGGKALQFNGMSANQMRAVANISAINDKLETAAARARGR